jgi:hypothetical protein
MKTVRSRRYLKEEWNIDLDQIAYDYVIYFLEIVNAFSSGDLKDPAFERSAYETIPEWGVQDRHLKRVTTSDTRLVPSYQTTNSRVGRNVPGFGCRGSSIKEGPIGNCLIRQLRTSFCASYSPIVA